MTARDLIWQLATIRYRRGITQAAIAEHMGVPRSAISRLKSEQHRTPLLSTVLRYCDALNLQLTITPKDTP